MLISKVWVWLAIIIVALVAVASLSGVFVKSLYARETPDWANQSVGQDVANIIATVPALVASTYFAAKGSLRGILVWMGVLLTLAYTYAIAAFAVYFNSLFLVYVAILGLTGYTLLGSAAQLARGSLWTYFSGLTKTRPVAILLIAIAVIFGFLWLSEDLPAIMTGTVPSTVAQSALPANPVHVLDLAFMLPGMLISGISLLRGGLLGKIFAVPFLVFSALTGVGIITTFVVSSFAGVAINFGVAGFVAAITLVSVGFSAMFLRHVK